MSVAVADGGSARGPPHQPPGRHPGFPTRPGPYRAVPGGVPTGWGYNLTILPPGAVTWAFLGRRQGALTAASVLSAHRRNGRGRLSAGFGGGAVVGQKIRLHVLHQAEQPRQPRGDQPHHDGEHAAANQGCTDAHQVGFSGQRRRAATARPRRQAPARAGRDLVENGGSAAMTAPPRER